MTIEEINNVEDKSERLKLLNEYIRHLLQRQRDEDEFANDEDLNATRDEAHGMMSRFGKPRDE